MHCNTFIFVTILIGVRGDQGRNGQQGQRGFPGSAGLKGFEGNIGPVVCDYYLIYSSFLKTKYD